MLQVDVHGAQNTYKVIDLACTPVKEFELDLDWAGALVKLWTLSPSEGCFYIDMELAEFDLNNLMIKVPPYSPLFFLLSFLSHLILSSSINCLEWHVLIWAPASMLVT